MTDFVGWVADILTLDIATIGTVAVTPGLMLAGGLIFGFAIGVYRRLKGRL